MSAPDELTPREIVTKAEGEAMLRQIAAGKPPEGLVGPDGKPLVPEDVKAAQERLQAARARVGRMAAFLKKMTVEEPGFEDCMTAIVEAYRMLFWSISELSTYEGMDNELLNHVSTQGRAVAQQGISLAGVIKAVKHTVLPYLQERNRFYAAEHARRQKKLARINTRLSQGGIALPGRSLAGLLQDKPMVPPMSVVLRGPYAAVREALKLVSSTHMKANGGSPVYLSSQAGESTGSFAGVVMPPAWWKNAASEPSVLESTLKSVVESETIMLLVEELEMLLIMSATVPDTPRHRKARALALLYSWAFQHQVSLVVGDVTDEDTPHPEIYGDLPHIGVSLLETGGRKYVVIGNDTLPVLEEKM